MRRLLLTYAIATFLLFVIPTSNTFAQSFGPKMKTFTTADSSMTLIIPKLTEAEQFSVGDTSLTVGMKKILDRNKSVLTNEIAQASTVLCVGLQDEQGPFIHELGEARGRNACKYATRDIWNRNQIMDMAKVRPFGLPLANGPKTLAGLSKKQELLVQRGFAFVIRRDNNPAIGQRFATMKQMMKSAHQDIQSRLRSVESWLWWLTAWLALITLIMAGIIYYLWNRQSSDDGNDQNRAGGNDVDQNNAGDAGEIDHDGNHNEPNGNDADNGQGAPQTVINIENVEEGNFG